MTNASIDTIQAKIDELIEWRRWLHNVAQCQDQRDALRRVNEKLRLARWDLEGAVYRQTSIAQNAKRDAFDEPEFDEPEVR